MKKILIVIILFFTITTGVFILSAKFDPKPLPYIVKTYEVNTTFDYGSIPNLSDYTGYDNDTIIDTLTLGNGTYKNGNVIIHYEIKDLTPPVIMSNYIEIEKNSKEDINNKIVSGDYCDPNPKREVLGDYDLSKPGKYNATLKVTDFSNNTREENITVEVVSKYSYSSSSSSPIPFQDFIDKYKTNETMIGIDISDWQGTINAQKVKDAGVEFAIIRMGYGGKNPKFDSKFKNNLKVLKNAGIKVGIYFYSYATNEEEILIDTKWIIDNLQGEKLDFPIAFDWEEWSSFYKYNISIRKLNDLYDLWEEELNKAGYDSMLYGSARYLNRFWDTKKTTWLAYYTDSNDFEKDYILWQLSSKGKVNGISGNVDIDIYYYKKAD